MSHRTFHEPLLSEPHGLVTDSERLIRETRNFHALLTSKGPSGPPLLPQRLGSVAEHPSAGTQASEQSVDRQCPGPMRDHGSETAHDRQVLQEVLHLILLFRPGDGPE